MQPPTVYGANIGSLSDDPAAVCIPVSSSAAYGGAASASFESMNPNMSCVKGCGRPAAAGSDARGKLFQTCCRGCAMGREHDPQCEGPRVPSRRTLSGSFPAVPLCVKGCGRTAAPGIGRNGRPLGTCCRGCATGASHDETCGAAMRALGLRAPPLCSRGCGRHAAAALDRKGNPLKTCCRRCASGGTGGHDEGCRPMPDGSPEEAAAALALYSHELLLEQARHEWYRGKTLGRWRRKVWSIALDLWDPLWGELIFEQLSESEDVDFTKKQKAAMFCFTCCPCGMVTCRCFHKEVKSGLSRSDVKRAWRRVFISWSISLGLLQIAALGLGIFLYGGHVPMSENPMIGPSLYAFDKMGAKNAARILYNDEWWLLLSPMLLHAGWLHLAGNIVIQFRTALMLEILWGSTAYFLIYVGSGAYASLASCLFMPDSLSVGSSGALSGVIGAWPPFILITWHQTLPRDVKLRNMQFVVVMLSCAILIGTSFMPMIDWAAHLGGMAAGAAISTFIFAGRLQDRPWRIGTRAAGFAFLAALVGVTVWQLLSTVEPSMALLELCDPASEDCRPRYVRRNETASSE